MAVAATAKKNLSKATAASDEASSTSAPAVAPAPKEAVAPVPKEFENAWFCPTFQAFVELGLPAGKSRCLTSLHLVSGSGPLKKKKLAQNETTEQVRESILSTGGRSGRRTLQSATVVSLKAANPAADAETPSDAASRMIMVNFNGLGLWTARSQSLRELIDLTIQLGGTPEEVLRARLDYKDHLSNNYKPIVEDSPPVPKFRRLNATPQSAVLVQPVGRKYVGYESGHECDDIPTDDDDADNDQSGDREECAICYRGLNRLTGKCLRCYPKRCVTCKQKMLLNRGRCTSCLRPAHSETYCITTVKGPATNGVNQLFCIPCFDALEPSSPYDSTM